MDSKTLLSEGPISTGRTAEIFDWGEGKVLKLFYQWFPVESIKSEAKITSAVEASGLRVPEVGEIVEINGRLGLEYERLQGTSMLDEMRAKPWLVRRHAKLLADLQAGINAVGAVDGIPDLRERIERRLARVDELRPKLREAALGILSELPHELRLCHGDFHPGNIILTSEGPIVIDWIDACMGNPAADVARTSIIIQGERSVSGRRSFFAKILLFWVHNLYLERSFQLQPKIEDWYRYWIPLVAAARLDEGITELTPWLLAQAERVERLTTVVSA